MSCNMTEQEVTDKLNEILFKETNGKEMLDGRKTNANSNPCDKSTYPELTVNK